MECVCVGWVVDPSCLKYYLIYSSFLTTTLWDPYHFYFSSGFYGLFPLAVMSPSKILLCFSGSSQRWQWCGWPTCSMNKYDWSQRGTWSFIPLPSALMSPYTGVSYSHWSQLPLLCNVAAAAGYCCGDSPALEVPDCGVYVWVCVWRWCLFFFFFFKSHCRHCQHSPKSPLDSLWK